MHDRLVLLNQIKTFNKDNVSNALMTKVKKYINNPDFSFENVAKVRCHKSPVLADIVESPR